MPRLISPRFFRFLLAGGLAAAVNFFARIALSLWLAYPAAILGAYLIGMTTAFLLNRAFVFEGATNTLRTQAFWFVVINVAAVLQTLAVSLFLAKVLLPELGIVRGSETIAHAVGVIVPVLTSYVGHKRLSFRS